MITYVKRVRLITSSEVDHKVFGQLSPIADSLNKVTLLWPLQSIIFSYCIIDCKDFQGIGALLFKKLHIMFRI